MTRRANVLLLALVLCALGPAAARGSPTARISARFTPERLGAATTVSFGFRIIAAGGIPAPLRAIELAYPRNLGFATSGLGLAACSPETLAALGPTGCPPDSQMGEGSAQVEIPIDGQPVPESVSLTLVAGTSSDGYLHLLIYAEGWTPVIAEAILSGVLLPGRIEIVVPPIPTFPEAPYVAVTQMELTLGGDLTYYEGAGAGTRAYRPPGVGLPSSCPRHGFPFAASFAFLDGSVSNASTAVACPHPAHRSLHALT
jgi:hypothetical protein